MCLEPAHQLTLSVYCQNMSSCAAKWHLSSCQDGSYHIQMCLLANSTLIISIVKIVEFMLEYSQCHADQPAIRGLPLPDMAFTILSAPRQFHQTSDCQNTFLSQCEPSASIHTFSNSTGLCGTTGHKRRQKWKITLWPIRAETKTQKGLTFFLLLTLVTDSDCHVTQPRKSNPP